MHTHTNQQSREIVTDLWQNNEHTCTTTLFCTALHKQNKISTMHQCRRIHWRGQFIVMGYMYMHYVTKITLHR